MSDTEKIKKYVYYLILGCFLVIPVVVFFFGQDLLDNTNDQIKETGIIESNCNLHLSSCTATFSAGGKITFSIQPQPIKPLVPLSLSVKVENMSANKVFVNFEGVDMYMGFYRPELTSQQQNTSSSLFEGSATLSVCTLEKMLWQASVIIATDNGIFVAPFDFEVDQS